jgi:hypothetical protein
MIEFYFFSFVAMVFFDLGPGNFFHQGMSLRRASLTENLRKGEFKLKTQPMGTN